MITRNLFSLILLTFCTASVSAAQSAEVAFHSGAQVYVDGRLEDAERIVDEGLLTNPEDAKLVALKTLIEEEKERRQQSGEGNSEQQQQERNEEQQPQPNQSGQEEESEQQESGEGEEEQQQDEQGQGEQQPQQPDDQQQAEEREQQSVESGENPDQLSRAQAIRILQALQNEEEQLLREVQKIKGRPRRVDKDW